MTQRKAIHAYVTDESKLGWETFAEELGCSVSALAETLGLRLGEVMDSGADLSPEDEDWARQSRKVDTQRRRRGDE